MGKYRYLLFPKKSTIIKRGEKRKNMKIKTFRYFLVQVFQFETFFSPFYFSGKTKEMSENFVPNS